MKRDILRTHVTAGHAAILEGITRQRVNQLCTSGHAPGSVFVTDGSGRGLWLVKLNEGGEPIFDRKAPGRPRLVRSVPTP